MQVRRWKAFLRLNGETFVERDDDILNEFKSFVQALKRVGIDYSIIVNVEQVRKGSSLEQIHGISETGIAKKRIVKE